MIHIYLDCDKNFINKGKYIFNLFFNCLRIYEFKFIDSISNIHLKDILIYYGSKTIQVSANQCVIHISDSNYNQQLQTISQLKVGSLKKMNSCPNDHFLHDQIPFIFKKELPSMQKKWYSHSDNIVISSHSHRINCSVDIIASAFYILSLENERQSYQRKKFNRFSQSYSIIGEEIYEKPFIEYYIQLLFVFIYEMMKLNNIKRNRKHLWPNEHQFALILSHDLDRIRTVTGTKIKRKLKETINGTDKKFVHTVLFEIILYLIKNRGWTTKFKSIKTIESQYNAHSTFFIASKHRLIEDPKYRLNSQILKRGIKIIREMDSEVALHGSIKSAENSDFLMEEKQILENQSGRKIDGIRNHYLSFSEKCTFDIIEKNQFQYDSTLGFSEKIGYRCGISLPFKPFNLKKNQSFGFWELPLILMDTVLLLESKMSLSSNIVWPFIEEYLREAHHNRSCLLLNWHVSNINAIDLSGYSKIYQKTLQWAYENNGWLCSIHELINWWSKYE